MACIGIPTLRDKFEVILRPYSNDTVTGAFLEEEGGENRAFLGIVQNLKEEQFFEHFPKLVDHFIVEPLSSEFNQLNDQIDLTSMFIANLVVRLTNINSMMSMSQKKGHIYTLIDRLNGCRYLADGCGDSYIDQLRPLFDMTHLSLTECLSQMRFDFNVNAMDGFSDETMFSWIEQNEDLFLAMKPFAVIYNYYSLCFEDDVFDVCLRQIQLIVINYFKLENQW